MTNVIDYRDAAITLIDDGIVSAEDLAIMALKYMSQAEVQDMLDYNEIAPLTQSQKDYDIDNDAPLTQSQKDYDIDNDPMFKSLFSS